MLPYVRQISRRLARWLTPGKDNRHHTGVAVELIDGATPTRHRRARDRIVLATALENRILLSAAPEFLVTGPEVDWSVRSAQQPDAVRTVEDTLAATVTQPKEVVFVDARVADQAQLVADLLNHRSGEIAVHVLESNRDGVQQISQALQAYENLSAVHVVSHGATWSDPYWRFSIVHA